MNCIKNLREVFLIENNFNIYVKLLKWVKNKIRNAQNRDTFNNIVGDTK